MLLTAAIFTGQWRRSREDSDTVPTSILAVMHKNRVLAIDHIYEDKRKKYGKITKEKRR